MNNTYLFLSDVDGTLVTFFLGVGEPVIQGAKRFTDAGGKLSLCTGRAPVAIEKMVKLLNVNFPCIVYNGGAIYDFASNKYLWKCCLNKDARTVISEIYNKYPDFGIKVYTDTSIYTLRRIPFFEGHEVLEEITEGTSAMEDIQGDIMKILLCCEDKERLSACIAEADQREGYKSFFASTHIAEIVSDQAGKDMGMKMLLKQFPFPKDHIFSAGDAMADLPMMLHSGISFAPEDAAPEVLKEATYIIPTVEQDGMAKAFDISLSLMKK